MIRRMDGDNDGKLSRAEAVGPLKQRFDQMDADEDGFVTEAELKKRFESMRRR